MADATKTVSTTLGVHQQGQKMATRKRDIRRQRREREQEKRYPEPRH